jgi:hypothetical protein
VAELAAEGLSNKETAQSLFVTVHTVEVHLSHVYAKLGVRSRVQLVRRLSARSSAPPTDPGLPGGYDAKYDGGPRRDPSSEGPALAVAESQGRLPD